MNAKLVTKISIKNRDGAVVAEKEVVTYAGLLARAHEEGLEAIETELVQLPSDDNGLMAVVRATVRSKRGTYAGIGDADPSNVNRAVVKHLVRVAETRAKARALRDATNIGTVSLEELGGDDDSADDSGDVFPKSTRPHRGGRTQSVEPMSEAQRRMLWRQAMKLGHRGEAASAFLAERLGTTRGGTPSKRDASRVIDELDAELAQEGGFGDAA